MEPYYPSRWIVSPDAARCDLRQLVLMGWDLAIRCRGCDRRSTIRNETLPGRFRGRLDLPVGALVERLRCEACGVGSGWASLVQPSCLVNAAEVAH